MTTGLIARCGGAVVAFAALTLIAGCGAGTTAAGPDSAAGGAASASTTPAAQPVQSSYTLTANEFSYTPNTVQLKVGQAVTLHIVNAGAVDHDLKSDMAISNLVYTKAANPADEQADNVAKNVLDVDFDAHTDATVTFTPTTAGSYTFHCDEPGHTEAGMTGTFVVNG